MSSKVNYAALKQLFANAPQGKSKRGGGMVGGKKVEEERGGSGGGFDKNLEAKQQIGNEDPLKRQVRWADGI